MEEPALPTRKTATRPISPYATASWRRILHDDLYRCYGLETVSLRIQRFRARQDPNHLLRRAAKFITECSEGNSHHFARKAEPRLYFRGRCVGANLLGCKAERKEVCGTCVQCSHWAAD